MNTLWFAEQFGKYGNNIALKTLSGQCVTYNELDFKIDEMLFKIGNKRRLIVVETANEIEPVVAYLAALKGRHPVILLAEGALQKDERINDTFKPDAFFLRDELGGWSLTIKAQSDQNVSQFEQHSLHENLSVLLSTSGTTGSAKLVKLSRENIQSNTKAIVEYLKLNASEKAITTLPFHYSFGMSVINTHLFVGATVLLTDESISGKSFWQFFEEESATSFSGVPYTFELLERIDFRARNIPSLRSIAQAGGRLSIDQVRDYAQWSMNHNAEFYVMYGQTEAGPRIAYVPPEQLLDNLDCIGVVIPDGELNIIDSNGEKISKPDQVGELVFKSDSVMMGYALKAADLATNDHGNVLYTGDLAAVNSQGLFKIVGRKSRFCKIYGLRIGLDEVELFLSLHKIPSIVIGNDDVIGIAVLQQDISDRIVELLTKQYKLAAGVFQVIELDEYPLLSSGKVDQRSLLDRVSKAHSESCKYTNLLEAYKNIFNNQDIVETDSFIDLGGDSLLFVVTSLAIEDYLGHLPHNWEAISIKALEVIKSGESQPLANVIPVKKPWLALTFFLIFLLVGETFLQVRSYIKTGRSAFSLLKDEGTLLFNKEFGVSTYRPNLFLSGSANGISLKINSIGLRSDEVDINKKADEIRIAVFGASTVAGAYAKNNNQTFPALMEAILDREITDNKVTVINAGIEGHGLSSTAKLVNGLLSKVNADYAIVYPGFNDITSLCRANKNASEKVFEGLPFIDLPSWLLSEEVLRKNTLDLRKNENANAKLLNIASINVDDYVQKIMAIVKDIQVQGVKPILSTVARAYLNIEPHLQEEMAGSSLYYYYCLDVDRLLTVTDIYNNAIINVANKVNIPLIDLAKEMPGGNKLFVDGAHFTFEGEKFTAQLMSNKLLGLISKEEAR